MVRFQPKALLELNGAFYEARFGRRDALKNELKSIPGVSPSYGSDGFSHWKIPFDCIDIVRPIFDRHGLEVEVRGQVSAEIDPALIDKRLHPHQAAGARRIVSAAYSTKGHLETQDMGLGKTATFIMACRILWQEARSRRQMEMACIWWNPTMC